MRKFKWEKQADNWIREQEPAIIIVLVMATIVLGCSFGEILFQLFIK